VVVSDRIDWCLNGVVGGCVRGVGGFGEQADLDDPEPSLDGISDEKSPFSPDLLVLFHNEPSHVLQALFVVSLGAKVDEVSGEAGHDALAEGGAVGLARLRVH